MVKTNLKLKQKTLLTKKINSFVFLTIWINLVWYLWLVFLVLDLNNLRIPDSDYSLWEKIILSNDSLLSRIILAIAIGSSFFIIFFWSITLILIFWKSQKNKFEYNKKARNWFLISSSISLVPFLSFASLFFLIWSRHLSKQSVEFVLKK